MDLHRNLREKSPHHSSCSLSLLWAVGWSEDGAVMLQKSPSFPFFNLSAALLHLTLDQALTYMTGFLEAPGTYQRQQKGR